MTVTSAARFDAAALYAALDAERRARGLSWREVAEETGVSASTITRAARGGRMETDGVMFLLQWLGLPAEAFLRGPTGDPPDLPTQISAVLRARRDLAPKSAEALEAVFRDAYERHRAAGT